MPHKITDLAKEEYIAIPVHSTVDESLDFLRTNAPKVNIFYLYVVDENQRLCGVISIRNLILAQKDTPIRELYSADPVFLRDDTPIEEAYTLFSNSRFLSLPILNEQGQILGVINAHELLDEYAKNSEQLFEERSRGELFELLGIKAEDASLTPLATAKSRMLWLTVNIVGGLISAFLIEHFGKGLPFAVQALSFVPVLLILSESVGMQTATLVISQLRHLNGDRGRSVLGRESTIAILLGLFLATPFAIAVFLWKRDLILTLAISVTIAIGPFIASLLGWAIPQIFHRTRVDARIASGPVLLAFSDSLILLVYLLLATAFFTLLK